jgi:putative heme iron utilization protein
MENIFTFAVLCKAMAGLKRKCQAIAGQSKKICKVFLGRDTEQSIPLQF